MAAEDTDPTTERFEGPTPAGGAYVIAHYRDAAGAPAPKDRAVAAEFLEYDAGDQCIARTHAALGRSPRGRRPDLT